MHIAFNELKSLFYNFEDVYIHTLQFFLADWGLRTCCEGLASKTVEKVCEKEKGVAKCEWELGRSNLTFAHLVSLFYFLYKL